MNQETVTVTPVFDSNSAMEDYILYILRLSRMINNTIKSEPNFGLDKCRTDMPSLHLYMGNKEAASLSRASGNAKSSEEYAKSSTGGGSLGR
jgi:hypothetical protein